MYESSRALFERSQRLIPGGVNSPVRAFRAVGGTPVFFREGRGPSPGCPAELASHTLVIAYTDPQQLEDAFARYGDRVAAVVLEPIAGNMNFVRPSEAFHRTLRGLCTRHGALLVFDEVMTGFRVGPRGAQGLYGITPDLTTLGKVIGGGMPVGAFGGRRDIMQKLAPVGPVYQAGTLSGNPVAVSAGGPPL